jgi:hypothetical protein
MAPDVKQIFWIQVGRNFRTHLEWLVQQLAVLFAALEVKCGFNALAI